MSYIENARRKAAGLKDKKGLIVLAIESSCDETAAAVLKDNRILSNVVSSQIELHARFGGVVPEIASRNHTLQIRQVVEAAMAEAGVGFEALDCIAVTAGAGLLGALLVGVSYAKALAYALQIPLYAVNHIQGHIAVNYIEHPEIQMPYVCLLASGGHTSILKVNRYLDIEVLGETQDDAAGEAFDKVARVLGLSYPGGPAIEKLAAESRAPVEFPLPLKNQKGYDFSYSGLKTAVIQYVERARARGEEICAADVAAGFQARATDMMVGNAVRAAQTFGSKTIVVAGGVGANRLLRAKIEAAAAASGLHVIYPAVSLCTDNAVMIAAACFYMIQRGDAPASLRLEAAPGLAVGELP